MKTEARLQVGTRRKQVEIKLQQNNLIHQCSVSAMYLEAYFIHQRNPRCGNINILTLHRNIELKCDSHNIARTHDRRDYRNTTQNSLGLQNSENTIELKVKTFGVPGSGSVNSLQACNAVDGDMRRRDGKERSWMPWRRRRSRTPPPGEMTDGNAVEC